MFTKQKFYSREEVIQGIVEASEGNEIIDSVSLSELSFRNENEKTFVKVPDGREFEATGVALKSLCTEAGIPYGYYEKVGDDLKYKNMSRRMQMLSKERRVEVNNKYGIIRGVVPKAYSNMRNNVPLEFIPKDKEVFLTPVKDLKEEIDIISNRDLSWRVILDEIKEFEQKSPNYLALTVTTSELGGFYSVYPSIYRQICTNGMIALSKAMRDPYRLSYSAVEPALVGGLITDLSRRWKGRGREYSELFSSLGILQMSKEDVKEFFNSLETLKVSKKMILDIEKEIPSYPITKWDLINRFTQASQLLNNDSQLNVELAMGEVIGLYNYFLN